MQRIGRVTVQGQLVKMLSEKRHQQLMEDLERQDINHFAWFNSLQNRESGLWLEVLPTAKRLSMGNNTYRTALRYRLFFRAERMIDGLRCTCAARATLDKTGHHLACGCGQDGQRCTTHGSVVQELDEILRYSGLWMKREEYNAFRREVPDSNLRPDISIMNPTGSDTSQMCLDVSITSTLKGVQNGRLQGLTLADAKDRGRPARKAYTGKENKYKEVCKANRFSFQPIIFESSGYVHDQTAAFIQKIAQEAENTRKIPHETLYIYFMKRLSFRLQVSLAESITKKLSKCYPINPQVNMYHITMELH